MHLTEQWILSHAPGPAVAKSGRALSEAGRFTARMRTDDALTCWGTCAAGANSFCCASVDWSVSESEPVCACTCSSPLFPCKHVLGLLYELLDGKSFAVGVPPESVRKAREKHEAERARARTRFNRVGRSGAAGKEKKLERQLEYLAKAEKLADLLLTDGLSGLDELPAQTLERLATELGNCGLPGARDVFERLALLERRLRQPDEDAPLCRAEMLRALCVLRSMTVRARALLAEQRAADSYALEDPALYELLGGVWSTDELREIGAWRSNARLVQLSFDAAYDELRRAETERAFWLELTRGDVVYSVVDRSEQAPRCEGGDDSCFSLLEVGALYEAPAVFCPRVWWEDAAAVPLTREDRARLLGFAAPRLDEVAARAKEQLRAPLQPDIYPALVAVGAVGYAEGVPVLADRSGGRIVLRDRREDGAERASTRRLLALPKAPAEGDALFGLLFYDEAARRVCLHPYSLVTAEKIVRLQY